MRHPAAEQAIIEATRWRVTVGHLSAPHRRQVQVAATEPMLFRRPEPALAAGRWNGCAPTWKDLPVGTVSSERMVDEMNTRLRRSHPEELEEVSAPSWRNCCRDTCLAADVSTSLTATLLSARRHARLGSRWRSDAGFKRRRL